MSKKDKKDSKDKKDKKEGKKRERDADADRGRDSNKPDRASDYVTKDRALLEAEEERRASKKGKKELKELAKKFGYTNESNPFGDANLLKPFVWAKAEKLKKPGRGNDEDARLKTAREIEQVRKRREEREREMEEMERAREEEARLAEAAQFGNWQDKEEEFHLEQTRVRSTIRLIEKRAKPIDLIAKNILLLESASEEGAERKKRLAVACEAELRDPNEIFQTLDKAQLQELFDDIEGYRQLQEKERGPYLPFWQALLEVCKAEIKLSRSSNKLEGVHKVVSADIERMVAEKSSRQLEEMLTEIVEGGPAKVGGDVEYWEHMIANLKVMKARAYVTEFHDDLLMKQMQLLEEKRAQARLLPKDGDEGSVSQSNDKDRDNDFEYVDTPSTGQRRTVVTPYDDSAEAIALLRAAEDRLMEEDETKMDARDEVQLEQTYAMDEKYRPRKPRYINVVKTGYEWNKYNQTHYDHDNPPPKTVQGYKFTIFYPDLLDRSVTPRYIIEGADHPDFAIIRFHAGPPYEDIAFKIVNREWEMGKKRGFRSVFERGVLQLYFNFKRHRYRR